MADARATQKQVEQVAEERVEERTPDKIGLCPDHQREFYMPDEAGPCPEQWCDEQMVAYVPESRALHAEREVERLREVWEVAEELAAMICDTQYHHENMVRRKNELLGRFEEIRPLPPT